MHSFFASRPIWAVVARVLAAVVGGYLLSNAWAVFCAALAPNSAEAALAGVQTSFVVLTAAVIWAFSPVSPGRIWLGLLALTLGLCLSAEALMRLGV